MALQPGLGGQQAEDAQLEPAPRPLAEDAGFHVDAVHLVQVGLDEHPLAEELGPRQVGRGPLPCPPLRRWGAALVPLVEAGDRVPLTAAFAEEPRDICRRSSLFLAFPGAWPVAQYWRAVSSSVVIQNITVNAACLNMDQDRSARMSA